MTKTCLTHKEVTFLTFNGLLEVCVWTLFVVPYLLSFLKFCTHLAEIEGASCLNSTMFSVLWLYLLTIPWAGLQYVIVLLPGHTHFCYFPMYLLFNYTTVKYVI